MEYRGSAHEESNLNYKVRQKYYFFQNLEEYDEHFLMNKINQMKEIDQFSTKLFQFLQVWRYVW